AGELVLTNLGRVGSPLIRYRTGDLVKTPPTGAEVCPCGRADLLLEGGIMGRVDDMVIVRGVNIYPTTVDHLLRDCGGVAEYQVKVSRRGPLTELEVTVEPDAACPDVSGLISRIQTSLQTAFALRIPVRTAPTGSLPRFEMKAKRWLLESAE